MIWMFDEMLKNMIENVKPEDLEPICEKIFGMTPQELSTCLKETREYAMQNYVITYKMAVKMGILDMPGGSNGETEAPQTPDNLK